VPGDHSLVLAEDVLLQSGQGRFHAKISIVLQVRRRDCLGPLPIKIVGFRDEQEGTISTQEITTGAIDPALITSGELPGWEEIPAHKDSQVECFLRFDVIEYLPEGWEKPND